MQKNRIEIIGYLAARAVRRFLPSGTPVANVRLGESYTYTDSNRQPRKQTNWHNLSFYGELADVAVGYEKGDRVFIEGTVEQRKFTPSKDGVERTVHEIIVRSCYLLAPPRNPAVAAEPAPLAAVEPEVGGGDHEPWPVG